MCQHFLMNIFKCVLIPLRVFESCTCFNTITFHDGGPYDIETSLLIYSSNQWPGFYMMGTSVSKELRIF